MKRHNKKINQKNPATNEKIKLSIFDMTDCEGCEVVLVSLGKKIVDFFQYVDIIDWRLGQKMAKTDNFDIAIIEGTPITEDEIEQVKQIRARTKVLVALGACAAMGGIPAIVTKADRQAMYDAIYGKDYKPKGIDSLPLSAYVLVDFSIHGCPVDGDEVVRILSELLAGKGPSYRAYSVCYDCKQKENPCRLLEGNPRTQRAEQSSYDGKACLGPITQGGCKAVCVSGGLPCYGCFGPRKAANIPALMTILEKQMSKKEMSDFFGTFLKATPEYEKYFKS